MCLFWLASLDAAGGDPRLRSLHLVQLTSSDMAILILKVRQHIDGFLLLHIFHFAGQLAHRTRFLTRQLAFVDLVAVVFQIHVGDL